MRMSHEKSSSESTRTWWFMWRWRAIWDQPSDTARHCYQHLVALLMFALAQIFTCAWSMSFWIYDVDFPGQIVSMVFVWLAVWTTQVVFFQPGKGLESFYTNHLRTPTEILNKHMSIGFTVPFLNLISHPFAGMKQVGRLTAAFVVTGVLNAALVYAIAYHIQLWTTWAVVRWARSRHAASQRSKTGPYVLDNVDTALARGRRLAGSSECMCLPQPSRLPSTPLSTAELFDGCEPDDTLCGDRDTTCPSCLERSRKHISDVSTLCTPSGYTSDSNGPPNPTPCVDEAASGTGAGGRPADALWALENKDRFPEQPRWRRGLKVVTNWARRNAFLTFSILLFVLVGLPLSCLRQHDLFLNIGFLFIVWLAFTSAQTWVKQYVARPSVQLQQADRHHPTHVRRIHHHRKSLTALAALLNPVLWTSLFLLCYGLIMARLRHTSPANIVAQFKTGNTLSDLIAHHIDVSTLSSSSSSSSAADSPALAFGAGDLATSILNAGIVSWGLKLFEYRAHLLSRGGLTVLLTTAIMALVNVVVWPILVGRGMGVGPRASALSFAARSVTIALGGPALESLGGDGTINAVGVVVSGILFQLVAGLWVLGDEEGGVFGGDLNRGPVKTWVARALGMIRVAAKKMRGAERGPDVESSDHSTQISPSPAMIAAAAAATSRNNTKTDDMSSTLNSRDLEVGRSGDATGPSALPEGTASYHHCCCYHHAAAADDDELSSTARTRTVANGITIGINAAAMGTSHLYEQKSPAAAYSALSMTTFGLFTVLCTVKSPFTGWLAGMVAA